MRDTLIAAVPYVCLAAVVVVGLYLVYDGLWGAQARNSNIEQRASKEALETAARIARRRVTGV